MKKVVFNLKRFLPYIILCLIIIFLLGNSSYDVQNLIPKDATFVYNNEELKLKNKIINQDNKNYISYDDIKSFFGNDVYFDKISRKIIFTTKDTLYKIPTINIKPEEILLENDTYYINVEVIAEIYNKELLLIDRANKIILKDKFYVEGTINTHAVSVYYKKDKGYIYDIHFPKDQVINVLALEKNKFTTDWVIIKFEYKGTEALGYVLKKYVNFDENIFELYENSTNVTVDSDMKMIVSENNILEIDDNINTASIDIFELSNSQGNIAVNERKDTIANLKNKNKNIYGSISNGYEAINFDNNVLSMLLLSDENREKLIDNIINGVLENGLTGIILDFKSLKSTDKELYTQFIKELMASVYQHEIKVGIKTTFNDNVDISEISKYVSYIIINTHTLRDLNSVTSGPVTTIDFIEQNLKSLDKLKTNMDKIVLELPLYSIIWKEQQDQIIDNQILSINETLDYITKNVLTKAIDKEFNQNYAEQIIDEFKYKIWIEDNYSIKQKIDLVEKYDLLGYSLYKAGYGISIVGGN